MIPCEVWKGSELLRAKIKKTTRFVRFSSLRKSLYSSYRNEENRTNRMVFLILARNSSDPFHTSHGKTKSRIKNIRINKNPKNEISKYRRDLLQGYNFSNTKLRIQNKGHGPWKLRIGYSHVPRLFHCLHIFFFLIKFLLFLVENFFVEKVEIWLE